MGQWKPLADELEPPVRRLVVRLREIKDQMGVSITTLAAKTAYSRSSWERYLNGRTLPPRQAVEALGRVSGADRAQLLALWEMAEHARSLGRQEAQPKPEPAAEPGAGLPHRAAEATEEAHREDAHREDVRPEDARTEEQRPTNQGPGDQGPGDQGPGDQGPGDQGPVVEGVEGAESQVPVGEGPVDGRRPRRSRRALIAAVVPMALAVLAVAGWMTVRDDAASAPSGQEQPTRVAVQPSGFPCHYTRRDGRLLAGHSAAEPLVVLNAGGEQVVEVQCLLAYHGHSPGRIDGLFGPHTEAAVREFQRAGGAAVDGKVGPQTWALLRA
jgi:transcriptional regulator with XRE-family HTH domain